MSYLVFARKWRPLLFSDMVGQEHITETLTKAIEKDRIAHAYIFSGTRGVGKTTTARILARALNCEKGPTATPCGECTTCKDIIGGSSFDVLEIDGASNNSVDDIRELRENIGYASMGGKYRIFVIDEVHMLSKSAFNALLKTLEEPPKNVIFIFATTEPQKIPATIHSRCQRYDFRRISPDHILQRLVFICDSEKIGFDRSALMLVARKADGSMRDALSLLDQVYSFCHDTITEKETRSILGLVGMDVFERVMDAIAEKKPAITLGLVQEVLYQGFDLHELIIGMQEHLRNLLFARIPDALTCRGIDLEPETAARFAQSALRFSEGDLLRMTEIVRKAEQELKWSSFSRFLVEIMVLKLVYLDSTVTLEQMVKLLGGDTEIPPAALQEKTAPAETPDLKKKIVSADTPAREEPVSSIPVASPHPALQPTFTHETPAACGEMSLDDESPPSDQPATFDEDTNAAQPINIQELWPKFLDMLIRDRPNIGSFLALASIGSSSAATIDLRFAPNFRFQYNELIKIPNREEIKRVLHKFTGRPIDIRITLETEENRSDEQNFIKQVGNIPSTINDEIEQEPIIQVVLEMFDGTLVE